MEWMITANQPGQKYLLQGNEAFARGAIEAGVRFASAYPGSPSSEILKMLGNTAEATEMYAEWSTNETVAFQAAMGASFSGVRALCVMKSNGLLVIGDALHSASLSGCRGGMVLLVTDDPSAHSSTNEFDSRHQARSAVIPMLEPADFQEAKEMITYAFDLSEKLQQVVMVRGVTRVCHGRGVVELGDLPLDKSNPAAIGEWDRQVAVNFFKDQMLSKLQKAGEIFETSSFNRYEGPENPELLVITSGTGYLYSVEEICSRGIEERVGILKIGTTWPLPENLVLSYLQRTNKVLILEEVDPFLEQNVAMLLAGYPDIKAKMVGRNKGLGLPMTGELDPDRVGQAIALQIGAHFQHRQTPTVAEESIVALPNRELTFCAGCPHRASYFSLKQAQRIFNKDGVVMGDIGCYTLGLQRAGHYGIQGLSCMGGGINMAEGLGKLTPFGFDQPVIALAGDSTYFHSCIPGLINARYHNADMLFIVLDNSTTAMTGFQPHPGTGKTCMGSEAQSMSIEKISDAIGCSVYYANPFEIEPTTALIYRLMKQSGLKVLILKAPCATLASKGKDKSKVWVDHNLCRGDECGCNRFCNRIWGCPGNIWDTEMGKAKIDEVVCVGCGVCASLCPAGAIKIEGGDSNE